VIVVDNNSTDYSVDFIIREFPHVRIIRNNQNYGFAKANNIGISVSRGVYLATLNNDTEVEPGWLGYLVAVMERDLDIGMCASKILLFNHRESIDSAAMLIYPDGLALCRGHLKEDIFNYNKEEEVLLPTACAALYRKEAVLKAGLFDEDYFAYGEDIDLGLRISMLGYKCIHVPRARVYHFYSGTSGENFFMKAYLSERNRIFTVIKCCSFVEILLSFLYTLSRYLHYIYAFLKKKGVSADFLEREPLYAVFIILLKVYICVIINMPRLLRKRYDIGYRRGMRYINIYMMRREFKIEARELALKRRIYTILAKK
jgi:GT2 family glycosyltransferase